MDGALRTIEIVSYQFISVIKVFWSIFQRPSAKLASFEIITGMRTGNSQQV